jgi:uncharacterized protein (DUF58 family)
MTSPRPVSSHDGLVGEALETALPAIIMDARRAAASIIMGEHGKRRAGAGDAFWQHREWSNGEGMRQIDWRHSARSDKLFVRERERQVPALLQIWCDTRPGMDWRSDPKGPTKAQRGLVLGLALAIATRAGGERVCAVAGNTPFREEGQFARILDDGGKSFASRSLPGQLLLVSDGLESPDIWAGRAKAAASARAQLIVILVSDAAEASFPYQGRVSFSASPGAQPVLIGRAQGAQNDYQLAYSRHMDAVRQAIRESGGQVFTHVTTEPAVPVLLNLAAALSGGSLARRVA